MDDLTEEERSELAATARRQIDFDDLQREAAGVDVGRYARFYPAGDARHPDAKKKKEREELVRRTLEELMRDPGYARLYIELGSRLRDAEIKADTAIAMIQAKLAATADQIAAIEDNAARGPNGQLVFRDADGQVVYADGTKVPGDIADGIVWPDNAPSAEDYFAAQAQQRALEDHLLQWGIYRNDVLGGIRDRYETEDPAMSEGDLQDALDDIERLVPDAHALAVEQNSNTPVAPEAISLNSVPTGLNT